MHFYASFRPSYLFLTTSVRKMVINLSQYWWKSLCKILIYSNSMPCTEQNLLTISSLFRTPILHLLPSSQLPPFRSFLPPSCLLSLPRWSLCCCCYDTLEEHTKIIIYYYCSFPSTFDSFQSPRLYFSIIYDRRIISKNAS